MLVGRVWRKVTRIGEKLTVTEVRPAKVRRMGEGRNDV